MVRIPKLLALTLGAALAAAPAVRAGDEKKSETKPADADGKAPAKAPAKAAPADKPAAKPASSVESSDVLAREPQTQSAEVMHVLVSWKDLAPTYAGRGGQDPRGAGRTREDADKLALDIAKKARAGADFKALMKEFSEDKGSAAAGNGYTVTPDAGLVPPFKALSLRLKPDEVGIVETVFGWHVIKRTK